MKRFLKPSHYLALMRKQPSHIQHIYAAFFAGLITAFLSVLILYFDYGFWRERYSRSEEKKEEQTINESVVTVQSPGEMIGGFFKEAGERFKSINVSPKTVLEGKEVYIKEEMNIGESSSTH